MARPAKTKVDYFPHVTRSGKTIAILEARWGNDGYAFWFKLLELLGDSNDFSFNCNHSADWEYLLSKTRVMEPVARAILDKLAEIEAIDAACWAKHIVWSDNFVKNLESVFVKRKQALPHKPGFSQSKLAAAEVSGEQRGENANEPVIISTETDKLNQSILEQSKANQTQRDSRETEETEPEKTAAAAEQRCPSSLRPGVVQQADTVFLTAEELAKLQREFGDAGADRLVTILDAYKTNSPDKAAQYRNDYKSILSWGVRELRKELRELQPGRRASPTAPSNKFNAQLADIAKGEVPLDETGDLRIGGAGCQQ